MFIKFLLSLRRGIYFSLNTLDLHVFHQSTDLFILCYHSIASNSWKYTVSLQEFKNQINFLQQEGYTFISTSDLYLFLEGKKKLPRRSVVLNFDDGYVGLTEVANFLSRYNIHPTLFMITNTNTPNRKELANNQDFLSTSDVKALLKKGWELGSHTQTHSNLAKLKSSVLKDEIYQSKENLEKTFKKTITYFSYPRGKYTPQVVSEVHKAGYKMGFTMDDAIITPKTDLLRIPRIGVDQTHTFNEFKTIYSPSVILFRKIIKQSPLQEFI